MIRELLATDVESIESVGAVGAVFEEVFFRFGKFASCGVNFGGIQRFSILAAFVLAEAVAAAAHAGCLNGESVWQNEVSKRDSIKTF